jgi:nucleotide-binding universal stress UspA family protein
MYKKILVPHAGTSAGDDALKHAVDIAKSSKAKILILHVVEDYTNGYIGFQLHQSEVESIRRKFREEHRKMKAIMEKEMLKRVQFCKKNKIKAELKITTGFPEEEIIKLIKKQKIDLIVMAKRRKLPGLKKLLALGSVSRKIIELTSCPVLMIDIEKK